MVKVGKLLVRCILIVIGGVFMLVRVWLCKIVRFIVMNLVAGQQKEGKGEGKRKVFGLGLWILFLLSFKFGNMGFQCFQVGMGFGQYLGLDVEFFVCDQVQFGKILIQYGFDVFFDVFGWRVFDCFVDFGLQVFKKWGFVYVGFFWQIVVL